MKESDDQKAFIKWLRLKKISHFAPMNENLYGGILRQHLKPALASMLIAIIENFLKAMGKRKGVSDIVVLLPRARTVFIELKRDQKSKLTKEQIAWKEEVELLGFQYYLCVGVDQAINLIEHLLNDSVEDAFREFEIDDHK